MTIAATADPDFKKKTNSATELQSGVEMGTRVVAYSRTPSVDRSGRIYEEHDVKKRPASTITVPSQSVAGATITDLTPKNQEIVTSVQSSTTVVVAEPPSPKEVQHALPRNKDRDRQFRRRQYC